MHVPDAQHGLHLFERVKGFKGYIASKFRNPFEATGINVLYGAKINFAWIFKSSGVFTIVLVSILGPRETHEA